MEQTLSLEDRWFLSDTPISKDTTVELRITDLIPGSSDDGSLIEKEGLHYLDVSLRGARLLPNVPLEALLDGDEDDDLPGMDPEPETAALRSWRMSEAVTRVRAVLREARRQATLMAHSARTEHAATVKRWAEQTPPPVLAAAAVGAPIAVTSVAVAIAATLPFILSFL